MAEFWTLGIIAFMAFLVCFSSQPPDDHTRHKAIYLNQAFYALIFAHCRSDDCTYSVLREIASLRYKSPTMVVGQDRLGLLAQELVDFEASGQSHPQIGEFEQVCAKARADGFSLTISGDMYPEL